MLDLADVAVLVGAIDAGSLAEAARRQGISPMAASRRLSALEAELGVRLVHRTTRSLALTTEGEAFLPQARALLDGEAAARAAVRPDGAGVTGKLRVTASLPFGRKVLMPLVGRFLQDNPEVRVDLLLSDRVVDLVGEGVDLAIRIARLRESALVARRLADSPRVLCAAPSYRKRHGLPSRLADLADHQCLTMTGTDRWAFVTDAGPTTRTVGGRLAASSFDAIHEASLAGLGVACLSVWNIRADLDSGALVPVPLADARPEPLAIWAVFPTAQLVPTRTRAFVEALEAHLRAEAPERAGKKPAPTRPGRA